MEYNSHSQEGYITRTFKAESLKQLEKYVTLWQEGYDDQIPPGCFKETAKLPKNFWDAGGFCSDDVSFICKTDGEDLAKWWNSLGYGFIRERNKD